MLITKTTVIKAIKTEPLAPCFWVHDQELYRLESFELAKPTRTGRCRVCAVGAVLRNCGLSNLVIKVAGERLAQEGSVGGVSLEDTKMHLGRRDYLKALSNEFELLAEGKRRKDHTLSKVDLAIIRKKLVRFVEKNFPNEFRVELDV